MSTKKEKQEAPRKENEKNEEVTGENGKEAQNNGKKEKGNARKEHVSEEVSRALEEKDAYIAELENRVKELESENSELKSQYLRKQADFENFRKRVQREKKEAIQYANSDLLLDLVSIIDDFERAIKSSEESRDFESFHDGIKLIEKQFVGMLERKYGLQRMESEGNEFDPQMHEAINMEERSDYDVQMVMEDYQRGYMLHDRVLRHAKVKVAVPARESSDSGGGNSRGESAPQDDAANDSAADENASDAHASNGGEDAQNTSGEKSEE
jgi:molecular chaperone GrpE